MQLLPHRRRDRPPRARPEQLVHEFQPLPAIPEHAELANSDNPCIAWPSPARRSRRSRARSAGGRAPPARFRTAASWDPPTGRIRRCRLVRAGLRPAHRTELRSHRPNESASDCSRWPASPEAGARAPSEARASASSARRRAARPALIRRNQRVEKPDALRIRQRRRPTSAKSEPHRGLQEDEALAATAAQLLLPDREDHHQRLSRGAPGSAGATRRGWRRPPGAGRPRTRITGRSSPIAKTRSCIAGVSRSRPSRVGPTAGGSSGSAARTSAPSRQLGQRLGRRRRCPGCVESPSTGPRPPRHRMSRSSSSHCTRLDVAPSSTGRGGQASTIVVLPMPESP